jgi:hypothetical protein
MHIGALSILGMNLGIASHPTNEVLGPRPYASAAAAVDAALRPGRPPFALPSPFCCLSCLSKSGPQSLSSG